jgi:uncharacterized protein YyaL (SSP411 family)
MRGTELVLICLLLLSQTNLAREKKAEYAHSGRAVLSFLDREFWDSDEGGFYANPYGNLIKLVDQQALVAQAHYDLYNSTKDKRHLERAEDIMEILELHRAPNGGCYRLAGEPGPLHLGEQAVVARAFMHAYRTTDRPLYRQRYLDMLDVIVDNMSLVPEGSGKVMSSWDPKEGTSQPGLNPPDYFEPARTLFEAYRLEGDQRYLDAAKMILSASEDFWDQGNYGYSHSAENSLRYSRDHVLGALAYIAAYDVTSRRDYIEKAHDILFYMVSRMGDQVSRTFYEAITRDGEIREPRRRQTVDHLLLVLAYLRAYEATFEDRYLNQGRDLLDSVLDDAFDRSVGSFTDQVGGGVMGDLEVQAYGAIALVKAYDVLTVGPSPLLAVFIISILVVLVGFVLYLFKKSWPY